MSRITRRKFGKTVAAAGFVAAGTHPSSIRHAIAGHPPADLWAEIGRRIYWGYVNYRRAGHTSLELDKFLEHERGMALIFWSMNKVWKDKGMIEEDVFRFSASDWRKASTDSPLKDVFDIHTHYIGDRGPDSIHERWTRDYAQMGHLWWFCPSRFKITDDPAKIEFRTNQAYACHQLNQYQSDMAYERSGTSRFILTTAPGPQQFNGGMLISVQDIANACESINRAGKKMAFPSGWITPEKLVPDPEQHLKDAQTRKYWKYYPPEGQWRQPQVNWLRDGTGEAFKKLTDIDKRFNLARVVCLHWSKDLDAIQPSLGPNEPKIPPNDDQLMPQAISAAGSDPARSNLKFILFHAGHPNHQSLANLLTEVKYRNIFAEIGGVFAALIMDLNNPTGAREFLNILWRNRENDPSGEGDGIRAQRILWGTDAIWYGSPKWQIEAFRRLRLLDGDSPRTIHEENEFKKLVLGENAGKLFGL